MSRFVMPHNVRVWNGRESEPIGTPGCLAHVATERTYFACTHRCRIKAYSSFVYSPLEPVR